MANGGKVTNSHTLLQLSNARPIVTLEKEGSPTKVTLRDEVIGKNLASESESCLKDDEKGKSIEVNESLPCSDQKRGNLLLILLMKNLKICQEMSGGSTLLLEVVNPVKDQAWNTVRSAYFHHLGLRFSGIKKRMRWRMQ